MMDYDDFRSILETTGVDVWTIIDTAIGVASSDHGNELKNRRDEIVERLYAPPPATLNSPTLVCRNCKIVDDAGDRDMISRNNGQLRKSVVAVGGGTASGSPCTPVSVDIDDKEIDQDRRHDALFDDEKETIMTIKDYLEDPEQTEESLVELLQTLAAMDLTFKALKETDIGRHVNRLRKHPSFEVRELVKQLVRKWKDLVDDWVRLNTPVGGQASSVAFIGDGDSPLQKVARNGHHQVSDFAHSPNTYNGSSGSDKNNAELERKIKANARQEIQTKPVQSSRFPASAPPNRLREQKEKMLDAEKLASASKRLQDNYKEIENAKKQRTVQVMDIHEIPKPKNTFFAKNKGSSHGRHR